MPDDLQNTEDELIDETENLESDDSDSSSDSSSDSGDDSDVEFDDFRKPGWKKLGFLQALATWCQAFNVGRNALAMLLQLLNFFFGGHGIPLDPRTVMKTPRESTKTKQIAGGEYYHFGIAESVSHVLGINNVKVELGDCVNLHINVDGLPVAHSKNTTLWPILGIIKLREFCSRPFCIAVFCGDCKPTSANQYLEEFANEYCDLKHSGMTVNGVKVDLNLDAVICDAPARAFVKCTKQYGGYGACDRCDIYGSRADWKQVVTKSGKTRIVTKVVYSALQSTPRTNLSFRARHDPSHHHPDRVSPFEKTDIDMVSQFVIDHMHAVWNGMAKKLLQFWMNGDPSEDNRSHKVYNLSVAEKREVNDRISCFSLTCPTEFQRKPRTLHELSYFKATEFRSFVCYYGLAALMGVLDDEYLENFKCLVIGMRILLSPVLCPLYNKKADFFLKKFVQKYMSLYGEKHMVINAHYITHLAEDGARYQNLDNVSSFPYESYLFKLKQMVRKPGATIQCVVRRIQEERELGIVMAPRKNKTKKCLKATEGGEVPRSLLHGQQFESVRINGVKFSSKSKRDQTVCIGSDIVCIRNIVRLKTGEIKAVVQVYSKKRNLFEAPFASGLIGMHLVSNLDPCLVIRDLSLCKKVWLLEFKHEKVAIEVNHEMV